MFFALISGYASAQKSNRDAIVSVVNESKQSIAGATVSLLYAQDSSVLTTITTDSSGRAVFKNLQPGSYLLRVTMTGYSRQLVEFVATGAPDKTIPVITLSPLPLALEDILITTSKQALQRLADRTVINVDAAITNTGTTLLEVLEKSPGITVDRAGTITLKGRPGVLVTIDNKPVYVNGTDLITLLESMNAGQAEQIEIIDNPPASFDASGNAGIINIKTKKSRQEGFNATLNTSLGHGRYYKNNNSLVINYRNRQWNYFLNYSMNANDNFMRMYALRSYHKPDGSTASILEQPTLIKGSGSNHMLRAGIDYYLNRRTTLGIAATAGTLGRINPGTATVKWMDADGNTDSTIFTGSRNKTRWNNAGINFTVRQQLNEKQNLRADLDYLKYRIGSNQHFENILEVPGGYRESLMGDLDADIDIYTAKLDYTAQDRNNIKWQAGWKSAFISTDNLAAYFTLQGQNRLPDLGKTNHFRYRENIQAIYGSAEKKMGDITLQAGLRYEYTGYNAHQLGNAVIKDSSFSRKYDNLFPSLVFSWQADSASLLSITGGRRIERPAFQKLNPFVFVINKYTYQQGNPFFRPQYTWNAAFNYSFRSLFNTGLEYSISKDYFSQIFLSDSTGTMVYTEGNVGRMWNIALSAGVQLSFTGWWLLSADATVSYKNMQTDLWRHYTASFTQFNGNIINQFRLPDGWSAEISGNYTSRSQQDIQEVVLPTGMLSAGVSKQVFKNKGSIKLVVRDIFYTQRMAGDTYFEQAHEYFEIKRDTRVCVLSFTYRFGRPLKSASNRAGGAEAEIERVENS